MTYTVSSGTLNPSIPYHTTTIFIILSSNKIQNGDILVPANPAYPSPPAKWLSTPHPVEQKILLLQSPRRSPLDSFGVFRLTLTNLRKLNRPVGWKVVCDDRVSRQHWTDYRGQVHSVCPAVSTLFHRPQPTGPRHAILTSSIRHKVFAYVLIPVYPQLVVYLCQGGYVFVDVS